MSNTDVLARSAAGHARGPDLDGIAGIDQNSFPTGHATIGMALPLGIVLVAPHASRGVATSIALVVATVFGIGGLATGWHRPSDTIGADLVCVAVFAAVTAVPPCLSAAESAATSDSPRSDSMRARRSSAGCSAPSRRPSALSRMSSGPRRLSTRAIALVVIAYLVVQGLGLLLWIGTGAGYASFPDVEATAQGLAVPVGVSVLIVVGVAFVGGR